MVNTFAIFLNGTTSIISQGSLHVYSIHIVTYRSKFLYSEKLRVVMNSDIVMLKHAELLIKETLKLF